MLPGYCGYCGFSYFKKICLTCEGTILVCGCDFGRNHCEEHFCMKCDEPSGDLNKDGVCPSCIEQILEEESDGAVASTG